jgi:hypothetical protein
MVEESQSDSSSRDEHSTTAREVETEPVDVELENLIEEAGIVDSQLVQTDEPVTVILGEHVNGNEVTVDVQHFGVLAIDRGMDEDEQAMYGEEQLTFSSVMVAAEDGQVSNEKVVDVHNGDVDDGIDALEQLAEDYELNVMVTANTPMTVEDGELEELEATIDTEETEEAEE